MLSEIDVYICPKMHWRRRKKNDDHDLKKNKATIPDVEDEEGGECRWCWGDDVKEEIMILGNTKFKWEKVIWESC